MRRRTPPDHRPISTRWLASTNTAGANIPFAPACDAALRLQAKTPMPAMVQARRRPPIVFENATAIATTINAPNPTSHA